jgi:hypothetical protein
MLLLVITSLQVANAPASAHVTEAGRVLAVLRTGLLGGLLAALVIVLAVTVRSRLTARHVPRTTPRPRWQYVLAAVGWLGIAWGFALVSRWTGIGLASRVATAFGIWSGAYGLVNMGRAACWGHARTLLWWGI